ncbi:MAG TPA: hypothetical protein ENF70_07295 [Deltaproteobacteria bacterium]|nr:hypothetical protein [Deltaproteobacteria bacterium]
MKDKNEIITFLKAHKEEMQKKYGLRKIGVFGSYVRGDAKKDSDIDIAVEMNEEHIFRNFFALEQYLRENLKTNVDLGIESSIKPYVKKHILEEIIYV